jgi:hypothetical protein
MSSDPATSVQAQIRPGKVLDMYYMSEDTCAKQAFPVLMNTRFTQDLTNKTQGSSTFIIPPQNGVNQICVVLGLNGGLTTNTSAGLALPRGWGYSAIDTVSIRYGGSSQYFFSGQQLLQRALRQCPNGSARDDLLSLGGNACASLNSVGQCDFASAQFALLYIALPHSSTTSDGFTTNVLPTDLLNQQIVLTFNLLPINQWMTQAGAIAPATAFNGGALTTGYFQVQQSMLDNQEDSLARRVDMNTHFYTLPLPSFDQQELQITQLNNTASLQPITLTGFRNGEVRSINVWLTRSGDNVQALRNPFKWYLPDGIQLLYGGTVYAQYYNQSSALWNLLNGRQSPKVNNVAQGTYVAGGTGGLNDFPVVPWLQAWVELPFAQPHVQESTTDVLVHGMEIRNGICNLQLALPAQYVNNTNDWVVHVVYTYNASLMFSKSTCDYCF